MKTGLKSLSKLKGKKRYIALALIGLELLSLPAAAAIVKNAAFQETSRVVAVEIKTAEPGVSRFLVTSNDGFGVNVEGLVGVVKTTIYENGELPSKNRFGDAAQLPGPAKTCAQSSSIKANPIYQATRKTERNDSHVVDRAVVFEFHYDAPEKPSFEFKPGLGNVGAPTACTSK